MNKHVKKLLSSLLFLFFDQRGEGTVLDAPPPEDKPDDPQTPDETWKELYGEKADKIEWPESLSPEVKASPVLKAFVDEEGKFRMDSLLKSMVDTKKMVGQQGVKLPDENSSDEEKNEFWAKLGYKDKFEEYSSEAKLGEEEAKLLGEDSIKAIQEALHKNRVPVGQAKEILGSLVNLKKTQDEALVEKLKNMTEETVNSLKTEWGEKAEQNFTTARKVLYEIGGEDVASKFVENPNLGSNPHVIKLLAKIGDKMFGEDDFKGTNVHYGKKSPDEAREEINAILGDPNDAYHNARHASHQDRVQYVRKLYEAKNA